MTQKKKAFAAPSSAPQSKDVTDFLSAGRATEAKKAIEEKTEPPEEKTRGRGRPKKNTHLDVRGTTLYLQDDYLDDLAMLCMTWHKKTKGSEDQEKLSTSAILRAVLEVCLPALEGLEHVENEAHLVEMLKEKLSS